jgi:hypothetical protein
LVATKVGLRILAATHRDLPAQAAAELGLERSRSHKRIRALWGSAERGEGPK